MYRATSQMTRREIVAGLVAMSRAEHHSLLWLRGEADEGKVWEALQAFRLRRDVLLDAARRVASRPRRKPRQMEFAALAASAHRREIRALSRPGSVRHTNGHTWPGNGETEIPSPAGADGLFNNLSSSGKSAVSGSVATGRVSDLGSGPVTEGSETKKTAARLTSASKRNVSRKKGGEK